MAPNAPFLPEPDPTPAVPPQKKWTQIKRAVLLWCILALFFWFIWEALGDPEKAKVANANGACEPTFWSTGGSVLVVIVLFALIIAWLMWSVSEEPRFNLAQEPAIQCLSEGKFLDAIAIWNDLKKSVRKKPVYRTALDLNLGEAHLWAGQHAEALEAFIRTEKEKLLLFASVARVTSACDLALVNAIMGDLPSAERWAEEAERRIRKMKDLRIGLAAKLCWARATILARAGKNKEVRSLLDRYTPVLLGQFAVRLLRPIVMLRAFAANRLGEPLSSALEHSPLRVDAKTLEQVAVLMAPWPEMVDFLNVCRAHVEE